MNKLVLFDIDKTLILNSSEKAFDKPIKNLHNLDVKMGQDFSGLTDQLILAQLLRNEGWGESQIQTSLPGLVAELENVYAKSFHADSITLLPGVRDLLDALRSRQVTIGLITGNLRSIAKLKLEAVGIYHYFTVGGFGDDPHLSRAELVDIAVRHAGFETRLEDVYVFGDTELDVQASLEAGVINAIAVSNGFRSTEQLLKSGAKLVLEDLTDTDGILVKLGL